MTSEILIYPALIFIAATTAGKLIERQTDVLYGPYIEGRPSPSSSMRELVEEIVARTGLRRGYSRAAMKFAPVSLFASAIIG